MASYNELKALIDAYIYPNGVQAITGQILNGVLKAIVDQVGAGYNLMGVAQPSDDPGTPDAPSTWFAYEAGTYTDFGGVTVTAGELAIISSDGLSWTKQTIFPGIQSVTASVDDQTGTPSVTPSYNPATGALSFAFENLKGAPGADGNDGAAAGFGTVGATVDNTTGTPAVSVQESGPNTAKNLSFQFTGMKGETGVTSVLVTVDDTVGSPSCAVSLSDQVLSLAFTGLKGAQGDTGSSVDYPFTIVNNCTTNDATQALSAAQGVQLESEISQLEAVVTNLSGKFYGVFDDDSDLTEGDIVGYAFVGTEEPLALYIFDGEDWTDTEIEISGIVGPPGPRGEQGEQGIQGPPGVTSAEASVDTGTGVPSVEVSITNGVLSFAFHNLKGLQGNTGSSVDYPFTIVNNTGTDDATQALSAAMGKFIQDQIDLLNGKIGGTTQLNPATIPGSVAVQQVISNTNKWSAVSSDYVGYIFPVKPLDIYTIVGGANNQCIVGFLTSNDHTANATPAFSTQKYYSARMTVASNATVKIGVPFDASYMYVLQSASGDTRLAGLSVNSPGIDQQLNGETFVQSSFYQFTGMINSSNTWVFSTDYHILIPIPSKLVGSTIKLKANATKNGVYAFLSAPPINGGSTTPSFSEGGRAVVTANTEIERQIPNGTTWLYLYDVVANRFQGIEILPQEKPTNNKGIMGAVENTAYSWWTYPLAITTSGMRKKLINGWVDSAGNIGISVRDFFGGASSKITLATASVDDHNAPAVIELADGKIAVIYTKGHNDTNNLYCRVSSEAGNYEQFASEVSVSMGAATSYAQVFKMGNTYYIFTRTGTNNWSYVTTEDFATFTSPHTLITASSQHYVKLVPVADEPNILRMAMYFNPTISNNSIRLGYIDFTSGNVYDGQVDNDHIVGTLTGSSIANTAFTEIITTANNRNRLFDIAVSDLDNVIIAYSTFTLNDTTDSVYHIYENGVVVDICHGGPFFYNNSGYMGGVTFRNEDELVLARADSVFDHIEIYERGNNGWERTRRVFDEKRGTLPLRNIRPIFDVDGLFLLWQRGKYNPASYTGYVLDIISTLYVRL